MVIVNKSVLIADVMQMSNEFPQCVRQILLSSLMYQSLRLYFCFGNLPTVRTNKAGGDSCVYSQRHAAVMLTVLPVLRPEYCDVVMSVSPSVGLFNLSSTEAQGWVSLNMNSCSAQDDCWGFRKQQDPALPHSRYNHPAGTKCRVLYWVKLHEVRRGKAEGQWALISE